MKEFLVISAVTFSVLGFYLWFILRDKGGLSYFKTEKGKGALFGVLSAVGAFLLVGLLAVLVSIQWVLVLSGKS